MLVQAYRKPVDVRHWTHKSVADDSNLVTLRQGKDNS